jgi:hypothetical protein
MSDRLDSGYQPLPPVIPRERHSSSDEDEQRRERRRRNKGKGPLIIHDENDYPVVETPSSTSSHSRKDSGVFSGRGSPHTGKKYYDSKGKLIMPHSERRPIDDDAVRDLTQQFNSIISDERMDRLEAEARANRLEEQLQQAKAEIEKSKRSSILDDRERKVSDRERSHREEQKRLSYSSSRGSPHSRENEVVVIQQQPPMRAEPDPAMDALAKARADWNKKNPQGSGKKW